MNRQRREKKGRFFCVCPECGFRMPLGEGSMCYKQKCPKCDHEGMAVEQ